MAIDIRLLGPEDADILERLAREDADFDLAGRGGGVAPLSPPDAAAYLADPGVLHWVAFDGVRPVGHLLCYVQARRAKAPRQLLLYEIGVRHAMRRRGIGRALVAKMRTWMRAHDVADVWVLADNPGALAFYRACGFALQAEQPLLTGRAGPACQT